MPKMKGKADWEAEAVFQKSELPPNEEKIMQWINLCWNLTASQVKLFRSGDFITLLFSSQTAAD